MKINYEQHTVKEMLKLYCDWLMEQRTDDPFFRVFELGEPIYEWYMVFYPVRTLLLGGKLLNNREYIDTALKYVDTYLTEQLPNGGFTSNFRRKPTYLATKADIEEVFAYGKVNVADNGSNITAIIQAAEYVDSVTRKKYIDAARRWFDEWVIIWALPGGAYACGIWMGEKLNKPCTCSMGTVAAALSAFGKFTGEYDYIEKAERCMTYQCEQWTDENDGRPVYLDIDIDKMALDDFANSFYLLEGMCWTHSATKNEIVKKTIEDKLRLWIFGRKGLLSQWSDSWFNYMVVAKPWDDAPGDLPGSRQLSCRLGWEMAKSNGIIHAFLYYLNNIEDNILLREKVEKGLKYLTHPLKCRMSGVMSDPEESYGAFAVQSTGFAGLSLAESILPGSAFKVI